MAVSEAREAPSQSSGWPGRRRFVDCFRLHPARPPAAHSDDGHRRRLPGLCQRGRRRAEARGGPPRGRRARDREPLCPRRDRRRVGVAGAQPELAEQAAAAHAPLPRDPPRARVPPRPAPDEAAPGPQESRLHQAPDGPPQPPPICPQLLHVHRDLGRGEPQAVLVVRQPRGRDGGGLADGQDDLALLLLQAARVRRYLHHDAQAQLPPGLLPPRLPPLLHLPDLVARHLPGPHRRGVVLGHAQLLHPRHHVRLLLQRRDRVARRGLCQALHHDDADDAVRDDDGSGHVRHHPRAQDDLENPPQDRPPGAGPPRAPDKHLPAPPLHRALDLHGDHAGPLCQLLRQELLLEGVEEGGQGQEGGVKLDFRGSRPCTGPELLDVKDSLARKVRCTRLLRKSRSHEPASPRCPHDRSSPGSAPGTGCSASRRRWPRPARVPSASPRHPTSPHIPSSCPRTPALPRRTTRGTISASRTTPSPRRRSPGGPCGPGSRPRG